jgi:hypothetical protein
VYPQAQIARYRSWAIDSIRNFNNYTPFHRQSPSAASRSKSAYSKYWQSYLQRGYNLRVIEVMRVLIETGEELFLEDADHNLLPKGEENGDFNSQKFKKGRVRRKWLIQCVIEEHEIVQRI